MQNWAGKPLLWALKRCTFCHREQHDLLKSGRCLLDWYFRQFRSHHSTEIYLAVAQVMFVLWDDARVDFHSVENGMIAIGLFSLCDCLTAKWTLQIVAIWKWKMESHFPVRQPACNNANSSKTCLFSAASILEPFDVLLKWQASVCSSATSLGNLDIMKHWKLSHGEISQAANTV